MQLNQLQKENYFTLKDRLVPYFLDDSGHVKRVTDGEVIELKPNSEVFVITKQDAVRKIRYTELFDLLIRKEKNVDKKT